MKPRLSLEETMNQLKARLEESEYKHAVTAEALENLLETLDNNLPRNLYHTARQAARKALNGIEE